MESITFARAVKKDGSSLVVFLTKEARMINASEGTIVEVTLKKLE